MKHLETVTPILHKSQFLKQHDFCRVPGVYLVRFRQEIYLVRLSPCSQNAVKVPFSSGQNMVKIPLITTFCPSNIQNPPLVLG